MGILSQTATWMMAASIALALVSHGTRHRQMALVIAIVAVLCWLSAVGVSVAWIVDQRLAWIDWRLLRGARNAPLAYVENQHAESVRLSLFMAGALLAVGTLPRRWLPPGLRWRLGVTMASLAIAAFLGCLMNDAEAGRAMFPLEPRLHRAFVSNVVASVALLGVMSVVWWAPIARAREHRGVLMVAALTVLAVGIAARVVTAPIARDLLSPPTLGPHAGRMPGRGPVSRPFVERCQDASESTSWIAIDERGVTASIDSGPADRHSSVWLAASELATDVSAMEPHLRAAAERGIGHVELAVKSYVVYPTATLGPIRDRRGCVIRGPLERVVGASTYGEMIRRLGGRMLEGDSRSGPSEGLDR